MKLTIYLRVVWIFASRFHAFGFSQSNGVVKLTRFITCEEVQNTPMESNFGPFYTLENVTAIDYNITVKKQTSDTLAIEWKIEKCASQDTPDTCEHFTKLRNTHYCQLMNSSRFVNSFTECIQPKMRCPIKKGVYIGTKCKLDPSNFKLLPLQHSYFRAKIIISDLRSKTIQYCIQIEGRLVRA